MTRLLLPNSSICYTLANHIYRCLSKQSSRSIFLAIDFKYLPVAPRICSCYVYDSNLEEECTLLRPPFALNNFLHA